MNKLGLKKVEESEIKLPTSVGSWRKHESSRKTFTSASLTRLKPLTHESQQILENFNFLFFLDGINNFIYFYFYFFF